MLRTVALVNARSMHHTISECLYGGYPRCEAGHNFATIGRGSHSPAGRRGRNIRRRGLLGMQPPPTDWTAMRKPPEHPRRPHLPARPYVPFPDRNNTLAILAAGTVVGAIAYLVAKPMIEARSQPAHAPDSAPGRTARRRRFGDYAVTGRTVTIARPRSEVFAFWRDFANLPKFMTNVKKVEAVGPDVMVWTIAGPAGTSVMVETRLVEERENEALAWRSTEDSDIETEGKISFRDAPEGRGTQVEAIIAWKPPAGALCQMIAKLFGKDPRTQGRHELKRLKMLMETGEIATARNRAEDDASQAG